MQLSRLQHPHLVQVLTVFVEALSLGQHQVNIVMEFCSGGDLAFHLRRWHPLGEVATVELLRQMLLALKVKRG